MLRDGLTAEKRAEYNSNLRAALAADPVRATRRREASKARNKMYRDKENPARRTYSHFASPEEARAARKSADNLARRMKRLTPDGWAKPACSTIKIRARRAGIPFNLEPSDITPSGVCPVFGVPFVYVSGLNGFGPSVDRIIPSLGYVKGNVAVISLRANILKRDCISGTELRLVAAYIDRGGR